MSSERATADLGGNQPRKCIMRYSSAVPIESASHCPCMIGSIMLLPAIPWFREKRPELGPRQSVHELHRLVRGWLLNLGRN